MSLCNRVLTNARAVLFAVAAIALAPSVHAQSPPVNTAGLGQGRYATMTAMVEKTIFSVDAFRVSIRFGQQTARDLEALARGQDYADARSERIARRASQAQNAYVRLVFQRDIDFDQFIDGVRESLRHARKAGMIDASAERQVSRSLPRWFSFLKDRGIRESDQILYRAYPDRLRTVYLDARGNELLDQTDPGTTPGRVMLAGYFAPGTDSWEPLVRSLFD